MKPRFVDALTAIACLFLSPYAWTAQVNEVPRRITARLIDLGEVHKIFLAQGLAAVVQLPYPITEVRVGSPDDIHAQISKTLPSELTLILKRAGAQPTNLIIRCGLRTFVFDLIPSKKTHQDLVRISGTYGGPTAQDLSVTLMDSSRSKGSTVDGDMVLIDSSTEGGLQ